MEDTHSTKLRCSMTAVHNTIAKLNADGTFHDRKRSGRPRKTTPRVDRSMRQRVLCSPKSSFKKPRAILRLKGAAISSSTVSRCLSKEFELKSHRPARKPHLTTVIKNKNVIAFELSLNGRKCCFLMNAPCSSLYLTTCTLGGHQVSILTRNML